MLQENLREIIAFTLAEQVEDSASDRHRSERYNLLPGDRLVEQWDN